MVAVGYGTDSKGINYWVNHSILIQVTKLNDVLIMQIVRNQWGMKWGQGGYVFIQRGVNLCRIEELACVVNLP